MAFEPLQGAVLGVAVQQLYLAIESARSSNSRFQSLLDKLKRNLDVVIPRITRIDELIKSLDGNHSKEVVNSLNLQLQKAEWLVSTCSNIKRWNIYKKHKYKKRLAELDESLGLALLINLQTAQWITVQETLSNMVEKNKKLDQHIDIERDGNSSNPRDETQRNSSGNRFYFSYRKKGKKGEKHVSFGLR